MIRLITIIAGVAIIIMGFRTLNDKDGVYTKQLKEKYTDESSIKYAKDTAITEFFFGAGLAIEGIFGSGIGYAIGSGTCLLGIILLLVFMKDLKKRNVPYRKDDNK